MAAIIKDNFRIYNAKKFYESLGGSTPESLYVYIGRNFPWDNEQIPDTPRDNNQNEIAAYRDMLAMKRIYQSDSSLLIPKRDWIFGTVYDEYSHDYSALTIAFTGALSLFDSAFYVVTDELNVYKCISNANNAPSTVKPTGTPTVDFQTSDGYVWKFMYALAAGDFAKFASPDFIPVKTLKTSNGSTQWAVQQAAIDGAIHKVKVVSGGQNYTTATVTILGDGQGCTANAVVSNGSIVDIVITNKGTGYRNARAVISGNGSGAQVKPIISPVGGHGSDPELELGAYFLGINALLDYNINGDFPKTNDYRRIGMVANPIDATTNSVAVTDSLRAMKGLVLATGGTGQYVEDELIVGATSGASAHVVSYDALGGVVYFTQNEKTNYRTFVPNEQIVGQVSNAQWTYSSLLDSEVKYDSGIQLFLEQRRLIVRDENQAESIFIVSVF